MAVDYDFVETDSAKIYTTVIGSLMESCNEALYPGDERRIFGEALVEVLVALYTLFNDKAKQRTLQNARGVVLDAIGARLGVTRAEAAHAYATFKFALSAAQSENIIIASGTRITTDGSVYFATQETAVLPAGETEIELLCVCTSGGEAYNGFTPGTIATLVDLIPYIDSVANTTTSAGGDDGEPYPEEDGGAGDEKYRERIQLAPATLSTAGAESAYRYFVLSADPDIVDVAIDCPTDKPNTVNLYPLMKGGAVPDETVLEKVLAVVSADDVRPMTDSVSAIAPTAVEYEVEIKYYCTKDNEAATIQTIEADGGAIDQYNAWQTAALSRDINPDQLRRFILAPTSGTGAVRVDVVKPTFTALTKSQVAKLKGTPTVTHEVVTI